MKKAIMMEMKNRYRILTACLLLLAAGLSAQEYPVPVRDAGGKYGYRLEGEWLVSPRYEYAGNFVEDMAVVKDNGKYGYINQYGEVSVAARYDNASAFSEGLAGVRLKGKVGFIDSKGSLRLPFRYDDFSGFSEGLAAVKLYGKWGYVDTEGKTVIPFRYEHARPFSDGLAAVGLSGGKTVFVDKKGNEYEQRQDFVWPFSDYAKKYVERNVASWQKKGRYEKTSDWQKRVNETTRKAKVSELTREAERAYIKEQGSKARLVQHVGGYDPDNEVFLVRDARFGDMLVPVPVADAPMFEESFYSLSRNIVYFVENDVLSVAELKFTSPEGKSFT